MTKVNIYVNFDSMNYAIEYFHARVLADIEDWPADILADYSRLVKILEEYGPNVRKPHSSPLGDGLFELRAHGKEGIGRSLYCFMSGRRIVMLHAFIKKTRTAPEHDLKIARRRMKEVKNG